MGSCIVLKKIPGALFRQALIKCGSITASAISLITTVNVRFSVAMSKSDRIASPRRTEFKPSHQWDASRRRTASAPFHRRCERTAHRR